MNLTLPYFSNTFVTILLIVLCSLASLDLFKQYLSKSADVLFYSYSMGMQTEKSLWSIGYRAENADMRVRYQLQRLDSLFSQVKTLSSSYQQPLRGSGGGGGKGKNGNGNSNSGDFIHRRNSRNILETFQENLNQTVEIWCEDLNQQIRIGSSDFRTDERDSCLLYAGDLSTSIQGPETIFEIINFEDKSFGLRSLSNGQFVQVIAPGSGDSFDPWKISLGGYTPGASERFRLSPDGYLYSALMGGFISCSANQALSGTSYSGMKTRFKFQPVDLEIAKEMKERMELSNEIMSVQNNHLDKHIADQKELSRSESTQKPKEENPIKICLGIPMTSKKTKMADISESPIWPNLFDSFMDSIDWTSNDYHFGFYLGFDKADELYDTGDAWSDMREFFKKRAAVKLKDQLIEQSLVDKILTEQLSIKLAHFDHLEGAPSQIVSQLMLKAYADNYDYFYQVNDDTQFISPNWASTFISALQSNPVAPNLGVTGPLDMNNDKIFTHSFVHRTHLEIFGALFPPTFKNWWSDDWISTVYGSSHTFRHDTVRIQHNVGAQKIGGYTRYNVDQTAKLKLNQELMLGYVQIDKWLQKHSYPRLSMPVVCGYIPLVRYLTSAFEIQETTVN